MSIIKCPECGHNVSTMAGTCPTCGVEIEGNLRTCPDCGAFYLANQSKCPECGKEIVHKKIEPYQPKPEPQPFIKKVPKRKKHSFWPFFITILIILGLGAFAYHYLKEQYEKKKEEEAYRQLENVTTPQFFHQFLTEYPESDHCDEVKEKMHQVEQEDQEWGKIQEKIERKALVDFAEKHPNSYRIRECMDMIDSIDWATALEDTTGVSMDKYLSDHPDGQHAEEAASRKNELAKSQITKDDKNLIYSKLETFFSETSSDSLATLTKRDTGKDILGFHYHVDSSNMNIRRETLEDSSMGYAVDFILEETIKRTDATLPNSSRYQGDAHLNAEKGIIKISLKR